MVSKDMNHDGNLDLLLVGNDYGMEPLSGRHDAFMGLVLIGNGKGDFKSLSIAESGFYIKGDGKGLAKIQSANGQELLIATQNQERLLVFEEKNQKSKNESRSIKLKPDDFFAELVFKNNKKRRIEFYYGDTFLSQSSRSLFLTDEIKSVEITNFKGVKRKLDLQLLK
jgi:hypothetical protein